MKLGKLLKIYCDVNDVSMREVAKEIGIDPMTVSRITNGKNTDIQTAIKLLAWLFLP